MLNLWFLWHSLQNHQRRDKCAVSGHFEDQVSMGVSQRRWEGLRIPWRQREMCSSSLSLSLYATAPSPGWKWGDMNSHVQNELHRFQLSPRKKPMSPLLWDFFCKSNIGSLCCLWDNNIKEATQKKMSSKEQLLINHIAVAHICYYSDWLLPISEKETFHL